MSIAAKWESPIHDAAREEPMGEMNTTPLIDVLLVLIIMIIITIPTATHVLSVDLPQQPADRSRVPPPNLTKNKVVVTAGGEMFWNGEAVSPEQLEAALALAVLLRPEPELQFEPEALASYETSADVLRMIKDSGATKFGFVGNERYREFD